MQADEMPAPVILTILKLHSLLWSKPIFKIAQEFNVPGDAMRALCYKYDISIPPSDYWTNPSVRIKTPIPTIKQPKQKSKKIIIHPIGKILNGKFVAISELKMREDEIREVLGGDPKVNTVIRYPDELIEATEQYMIDGKGGRLNLYATSVERILVNVEKHSHKRALCFLQALMDGLRIRGHKVFAGIDKDSNNKSYAVIYGQDTNLYLKESGKRSAGKILYDGKLQLLTGFGHKELCISDGSLKIEQKIVSAIAKLELKAIAEKKFWIENEKRHRKLERQEAKEENEKRKAKEELDRFRKLIQQSRLFEEANRIRKYVTAVREKSLLEGNLTKEVESWINWASGKADLCDPLITAEDDSIKSVRKAFEIVQQIDDYYYNYRVNDQKENFWRKKWWNG